VTQIDMHTLFKKKKNSHTHAQHYNTSFKKNGNTPLHCAAEEKKEEVMKYLISVGCKKNAKNKVCMCEVACLSAVLVRLTALSFFYLLWTYFLSLPFSHTHKLQTCVAMFRPVTLPLRYSNRKKRQYKYDTEHTQRHVCE
jgi:hypothetical protein